MESHRASSQQTAPAASARSIFPAQPKEEAKPVQTKPANEAKEMYVWTEKDKQIMKKHWQHFDELADEHKQAAELYDNKQRRLFVEYIRCLLSVHVHYTDLYTMH